MAQPGQGLRATRSAQSAEQDLARPLIGLGLGGATISKAASSGAPAGTTPLQVRAFVLIGVLPASL